MLRRHTTPWLAVMATLALLGPARADDDLTDLQEQAAKAALKKVAPSVVQIETSGGTEVVNSGGGGRPGAGGGGLIRRGIGPTTGLIVGADGYIISSAFNFNNKPTSIIVKIPGQKQGLVAKAVATDNTRMLTLLKVDAKDLPLPVPFPTKDVQIGQTALAVGRTLAGADAVPSVSTGIISAKGRIWGKAMQTDAKVSPTNYGGPLIDLEGRVFGVLVPADPQSEGDTAGLQWYDSGIGFAISLEEINGVLPRLKKGENLRKGLLGINLASQDIHAAEPKVGGVAPGSAAEKAGIKVGDLILEVDGKPIQSYAQVLHTLGPKYEGDAVSVKIKRDKDEIKFDKIVLAGTTSAFGPAFLGILPMRDDPGPGVEVRYVYPKSPAEAAKIQVGDRIMKVSRAAGGPPRPGQPPQPMQPVANRDALMTLFETLTPNTEIKLELTRKADKKTETVTVKLGEIPEGIPAELPKEASAKKALEKPKGPGAPAPAPAPAPKDEAKKDDEKKEEKKPETKDKKGEAVTKSTAAGDRSYWIYIPNTYDPNVSHAVVVWLHPPHKNKEKDIDNFTYWWEDFCDDHNIILVGPKTDNEAGWTPSDADMVAEAVKYVTDNYTVDRRRVVAHGMGMGGQMAFYLGFHQRATFRGVAPTGAALTANPKERVANQPLAFFLSVGTKDPIAAAVKDTRDKLIANKLPVSLREMKDIGHQYLNVDEPTLKELVRWIDSLDRI